MGSNAAMNHPNLLDTIKVDENVHSKILRLLLKYHKESTYPLLESFSAICTISEVVPSKDCANPLFSMKEVELTC